MDSNIIGSIIGACATILAALIGLIGIIITIKKKKTNDSGNITQNAQGNNITQIGTLIQNDVQPIPNSVIDAIIDEGRIPNEVDKACEKSQPKSQQQNTKELDEVPFMDKLYTNVTINSSIDNVEKHICVKARIHDSFSFDYSNYDGEIVIGTGEYQFTTKWSKASDTSIHAYKDAADIDSIALIKGPREWADIIHEELNFTSRCRTPKIGDIVIWKNNHGKYAATKIVSIADDTRGAEHDNLTCEYIIFE